ncbi:MAG: hypothetical protein ACE5RE_04455, partial [Candidatus Nitrosomaritimum aestuariumsis]
LALIFHVNILYDNSTPLISTSSIVLIMTFGAIESNNYSEFKVIIQTMKNMGLIKNKEKLHLFTN